MLSYVNESDRSEVSSLSALNTALVDQVAASFLANQNGNNVPLNTQSDFLNTEVAASFDLSAVGGVANGRIVPQMEALLSASLAGTIANIYISEGDSVKPGQILMVLNDSHQMAAFAKAQADYKRAVAEFAKVKAPVRSEEIAAAEAALDASKAELQRLTEGILPGQLAIAEASLNMALASKEQLVSGPKPAEIQAARAEVEGTELFLKEAQRAYDQVAWRNDVGLLPEATNLQRATVQYNSALAAYQASLAGATDAEISEADAAVERYRAELNMIQSSMPSDLEAILAEVRFYESKLELLRVEPLQVDLDVAQAKIDAEKAKCDIAEAELAKTVIRAPFAGTIAMIDLNIGERVQVGQPLIRVADLTSWQIETADLTEFDVANIEVGRIVEVRFDAIPNLTLNGKVKNVRLYGEDQDADTYFKAIILPEKMDERMRWNMTAYVTFTPGVDP
ncbi:MAG: HlyD family efflux transporter periplasmic adaptor subunit [Chloroflexota bacterium]